MTRKRWTPAEPARQFLLGDTLLGRFARLTAAMVALSALIIAGVSHIVTGASMRGQLDSELIAVATTRAESVLATMCSLGGVTSTTSSGGDYLALVRSDQNSTVLTGERLPFLTTADELAIARTQLGHSARSVRGTDGQSYRVVSVPVEITCPTSTPAASDGGLTLSRYALVVGRTAEPMEQTLDTLRNLSLLLGLVFVLAAIAAGYNAGRSVVRPVQELSKAANHVATTNDLTPIPVPQERPENELTEMAGAFNTMLNSLSVSRNQQKRLIADAGHELRTPLTSMRTNVELLLADAQSGMLPPEAREEILGDVAAQLGEFTSLVGDLVHLSREEPLLPNPEPLDLAEVVENAVTRARRRGHGLTFDVEVEPFYVVGEPDSLERAITNLLDNAVKFSPPDGTIYVRLSDGTLSVHDQGPGIAEPDLPHVFERFFRSDKARQTPGTGLGLSIVAHTISGHGGEVTASNAPEGGAVFTVKLPGAEPPADAAPRQ